VFDGATGALLATIESPNGQQAGVFGSALAPAGDADGDGRPELLIGATGEDTPAGSTAGRAYVMPAAVVVAGAPGAGNTSDLAVTPNPASGNARITVVLAESGSIRLSVVDVLGREVARPADGPRAAGRHVVPLAGLPAGAYLVRLTSATGPGLTTRFSVAR
jgi:hypothetical protein